MGLRQACAKHCSAGNDVVTNDAPARIFESPRAAFCQITAEMPGVLRQLLPCLIAMLLIAGSTGRVRAADLETRAFNAAEKFWQDKFYENAERAFAEFASKYPASPRLGQALLFQSKAALAQKKYPVALNVLATNFANAAGIADQFQLQIAKVHLQSGQPAAAADAFALVISRHTNSSLRLEATLEEAKARFQLKQWARVSDLLQNPSGVLAMAAAQRPELQDVIDGRLLLGEALLEQRRFAAAEDVASSIPETALNAELRWRREYLRAKAQFGGQELEKALATSSNVVAVSPATLKPSLEAAAVALQGQILEALNQPGAAIAAYEQNQRPGVPAERVREAVFKIAMLSIAQGQLTGAVARLEKLIEDEPGSDVALLTLAELRLKQHHLFQQRTNAAAALGPTNLLAEAITNAQRVTDTFTNSPFIGQAHLVRAWALLAQGNTVDSLAAFRRAVEALPWSEDQAVARFKVADLELASGEVTNALRNYRRVLGEYMSLRRVQSELVPRARYQMLQASYAARDLNAATEVMKPILREYPANALGERTLLLYGQVLDELGKPAMARREFSNFVAMVPNSPLRPEVELAVARTFESERNWTQAIAQYDAWVANFPSNQNLAEAEFRRALANLQAGRSSNALNLLTNYVSEFRQHPLAQHAQYAIADLYSGQGQYLDAEREYQRVYQNTNWPRNSLTWEAQLKAGRTAMKRQNFEDAKRYFRDLIDGTITPPETIMVQAYLALGETFTFRGPAQNATEGLKSAVTVYAQVERYYPQDPLVPRALGEIGSCYFQLAGIDNPTNYDAALDAFTRAAKHPAADVSTWAQAQVGIGKVLSSQARLKQTNGTPAEASALLDSAQLNFLTVLYTEYDSEVPDPTWIREAAINAAEIAESRNKWDSALRVYRRLADMLPALRNAGLDRKIANALRNAALQDQ
jgi:TolA-binding protein